MTALKPIILTVLVLFGAGMAWADVNISTQSFVLFNTKCALCHEGECSARMCFKMESGGAAVHIRNYAGPVSDKIVEELYAALRHMKKKCSYCPSPVEAPANGIWSEPDIAILSLSSRQAYFIPLGELRPVKYTLHLTINEQKEFRVEILSQDFEPVVDEHIHKPETVTTMSFMVEEASKHYLRIRSREPLHIKGLKLDASGK